ncbi:hypothetical protein 3 [Wenzhou tombus-like virus 3]|uniref:hypothetical protein 3 n=1 Tax=Wenzhou tombus-like virus 3 TaxID=1923673 RepID=UPI0009094852|nr:hypothetical protein 3 [Wenzhou tombus-like virus 3]APG76618.1 hypothetical protein 3 [Wenzhou tombus-like virus 3]
MTRGTPVPGGVRRRRVRMPMLSGSGTNAIIKYSALGGSLTTGSGTNQGTNARYYIPGYAGDLTNAAGAAVVSYYSTAKFLPGTRVKWEPSVSFTTAGRVIVGFTDNPEVVTTLNTLATNAPTNYSAYINAVRSLGNVVSFPVWQETEIPFPTRLRRKRFDINASPAGSNADQMDRSAQTVMFVAVEGAPATTSLGSFWYHDVVDVEGVTGITT